MSSVTTEEYQTALAEVVRAEVAVRRWTQAATVSRFGFSRGSYRGYFQTCETPPTLSVIVRSPTRSGSRQPSCCSASRLRRGRS